MPPGLSYFELYWNFLYWPVTAVLFGLVFWPVLRPVRAPLAFRAFCVLVCVLFLFRTWFFGVHGWDFRLFHEAGRTVLAGLDPYGATFDRHPFLNLPTILPLFAAFGSVPEKTALAFWTAANLVMSASLVPLARLTMSRITAEDAAGSPDLTGLWHISPEALFGLTTAVLLSDAVEANTSLGQMGVFAGAALVAAVAAQSGGRPVLAGMALAAASVKVGTLVPFLLLFLRRKDLPAWVAMAAGGLALSVATGHPEQLPMRLAELWRHIRDLGGPGSINDYSYANWNSITLIGLDHALYRLGLRDRGAVQAVQGTVLLGMGAWLARMAWCGRRPRGVVVSLTALYSVLFLYHRFYDAVVLVLPLAYAAGLARSAGGARRIMYLACVLGVLLVLNFRLFLLPRIAEPVSLDHPPHRFVEWVVAPYATWLILLMIVGLYAVNRDGEARSEGKPVSEPV